jgi:tetratricopeptide (TPR) repeat protein
VKPVICIALLTLCSAAANNTPKAWSDWVSEGKALTRVGNFAAAAQAFRQALSLAEAANTDERKLVEIHDALASAYAEAGQYSESEHDYRNALALAKKTEGRRSLTYALLVASMAVLPTQIGNREPEIEQLREAIAANRGTGSTRALMIVRACLAQLLKDAKRYNEAESVLLDAQADLGNARTTEPRLIAELLNNLGVLRFDQERYGESVDLFHESLRIFKSALGEEHPWVATPLNNLGLSYLKLGRLNDAELTLRSAVAICGKTLGEDHATCGALLEGYAVVLRKLNRKREAKVVAARSQQITRASRIRNGVGSTISIDGLRTRSNNAP